MGNVYCYPPNLEDIDDVEEEEWAPATELRFLRPGELRPNCRVALASYPRSGNTLLRCIVERLFGVVTGSDGESSQLKRCGLSGESVTDDSVLAVKTHFPERRGRTVWVAGAAILLVRSPFHTVESFFQFNLTSSQNKTVHESQRERFNDVWESLVETEIVVWREFHNHWLRMASDMPILILRYEDLVHDLPKLLPRIANFIAAHAGWRNGAVERPSDLNSLDELPSTVCDRISELCTEDVKDIGAYPPRTKKDVKKQKLLKPDMTKFTEDQVDLVERKCGTLMRKFGYGLDKEETRVLPIEKSLLGSFPGFDSGNPRAVNTKPSLRAGIGKEFTCKKFKEMRQSLDEPVVLRNGQNMPDWV